MKPITTDELHRHIQATIFGRPGGARGRRFDQLQAELHTLVDDYFVMWEADPRPFTESKPEPKKRKAKDKAPWPKKLMRPEHQSQ